MVLATFAEAKPGITNNYLGILIVKTEEGLPKKKVGNEGAGID